MEEELKNTLYQMGLRDGRAYSLAETYKKQRCPQLAKSYERDYQEQHFSHKWHIDD